MRKIFFKLLLLTVVAFPVFSQITLDKDEYQTGYYRLTFRNNGYAHSIHEQRGQRIIRFEVPFDEGFEATPVLPRKDIFIALPPNNRAPLKFFVLGVEAIMNVTPELTPKVRQENDSLIVYDQVVALPPAGAYNNEYFKFKGYLWIAGTYCAHVTIYPYLYDGIRNQILELKQFQIDVETPPMPANTASTVISGSENDMIVNPKFAAQWQSAPSGTHIARADSWIDFSQEYLKIGTAIDGIYRLTYSDLQKYGVPVGSINPRALKLYLKGKEVPVYVSGESDNTFDAGDYVEFVGRRNYGDSKYREAATYGTPYREYINRYTDTTTYWLSWGGGYGTRVDTTVAITGVPKDTTLYYDEIIHFETNKWWDYSMSGGDVRKNYPDIVENKTWLSGSFGVGSSSASFSVVNLYPDKPARAFVKIQDYSSSIEQNAHNLALSINTSSTTYDSGYINKYQVKTLAASFSSSLLANGNNVVKIISYAIPQNSVNSTGLDWFELEYPRTLSTNSDSLVFAYRSPLAPSISTIRITGVTDVPYSLYRFVWRDSSVVKITNYVRSSGVLQFIDTIASGRTYFLVSENKTKTPFIYYKKKFVNLRSVSTQADYIAITHPYFKSVAEEYVSFIAMTYNVAAKLVDVYDIYDEYNYGFYAAEPIRDFLLSTHQYWRVPKPKFVFLIGKTTYDFYGNKTQYFGNPVVRNFVPSYGNPVSDVWYTIWDSTGAMLPQICIGRVPAKNIQEFQSYFAKHRKYVSKGYDDWNKRYIFFSGGAFTDTNQIAQDKAVNDAIIRDYASPPPTGGLISNFYKTANPISNFGPYTSNYVKNAIDQGGIFISYLGHSGTQTWDNSISDIGQLANIRDRNPLITDFGCSTGKFAEPDVLSFSELATSDLKGQAIAYVGNSSLGFTTTAYSFPSVFYKKLLIDTSVSIGESHRLAKLGYIKQYGASSVFGLFVQTNTLLGDPIVKLPIPTKPNFSLMNTTIGFEPAHPTEQTDTLRIMVLYNNYGKVVGDSVDIQVEDEFLSKIIYSKTVKRKVPLFTDSITASIPIRLMPGGHKVSVRIDPFNRIDEITKNDNNSISTIVVASSNTRNMTLVPVANQTNGECTFLNPSVKSSDSKFVVEVSTNSSFSPSQTNIVPFDTFSTKFRFVASLVGKRLWAKTTNEDHSIEGLTYSYFYGSKTNYFINDSISFGRVTSSNTKQFSDKIVLDTTSIQFTAISAGYNDGLTAVIMKNGQNFIPSSNLRGHHVVLFDAKTYEYFGYYWFEIANGASVTTKYKIFLDTLTSKYIAIIAVCDDGSSNLDTQLKTSIKQLGSYYIDSIGTRNSWAIIGRKGAAQGTVPEKFSRTFSGRVQVDTSIRIPSTSGTFATEPIGPVAAWKNAVIGFTKPSGGTINVSIVGIKADNSSDTLNTTALADSTIDLSAVNVQKYPTIKLTGVINRVAGQLSPTINSIAVNFDQLAELGTNYQAVRAFLYNNAIQGKELSADDTVLQGEKVLLKYRVYNAGGSAAKKFGVQAGVVWENNTTELLSSNVIDSLPPQAYREFSAIYNTTLGSGRRSFRFTVDPDSVVRELFKDNNIFAFPIYVKKDSSKPLLPNLALTPKNIYPLALPITNENDSAQFAIVYSNTGAFISDSLTISVRQFYKSANVTSWIIKRKYPPEMDTVYITVPILKRAGEHQLQVELDPVGLIVESSEADNTASVYFTVATTDFKIAQPTSISTGAYSKIIFLNPTNLAGVKLANLELDTLENYSTARKVQLPMLEFTTSYDISSLPKAVRYYWRIKQEQSDRDWTTGSFYLGESTMYSIGQIDSSAWKSNVFVHAAATASGVTIADTRTTVKVLSAGFNDGRTGSIEVNGVNVIAPVFGTGHNLVVIDTASYSVVARRRFDISNVANESDSLTKFLASVYPGFIVGDVVVDEGSNNLKQSARDALKSIGSALIDKLTWRDSWAIIGRKGAASGSVPESYVQQFGGTAGVETTFVKKEFTGSVTTHLFGPLSKVSAFAMSGVIPSGTSVQTLFSGTRYNNVTDTLLLTTGTVLSNPRIENFAGYESAKITFTLQTSGARTPTITGWSLSALPSTDLAVSERTASVSSAHVMQGEPIRFTGKIFNLSSAPAESVTVQLSVNENGFDNILKTQKYPLISGYDSVVFAYEYSSKGKKGNYAFTLNVDPADSLVELSKDNNMVSVPFFVQSDTVRPHIEVTIDGEQVLDGDYIRQQPEIIVRYSDNNPTAITIADTANYKIRLNNFPVYYLPGTAELVPSLSPGQAHLKWTPILPKGENYIQIFANDVSGNSSDTTTMFVNVSTDFILQDVYNIPNPFAGSTHFTFNLLSPVNPDEVSIKIFTVAGRMIQDIPYSCKIGFNKIFWDGRDRDGDEIANGVYFYKIIVKQADKQTSSIGKLVKMK